MPGKFALIIGNSHYDDSSLGRLRAPDVDVQGLEGVLKAPEVGHFDEVTTLLNEGCASVRKAVARFYDQRQRDDLLLLYFSGHGVKDEQGHLYLALRDTESTLLAGTAIETAFITGRMDRSFSKRQVLVLDCCHSGAFAHGAKAAQGVSVGTAEAFEGIGVGRVILTATDSTQYAWEGDQIIGDAQNSLFTHFLIDGLKTGAADRDNDGVVTVDELYDYVREQVVNTTPRQTPYKWTYRQQGEIVLAQNPFVKRVALPPEIEEAIKSKLSSLRLEAVRDLEVLLRGHHVGRAHAASAALKDLSLDDSRKVANAAIEALGGYEEQERRRQVGPHLAAARAAIEGKQFEQALESLRQASEVDAQAEGLAELVRLAEEGKADIQGQLAELALMEPTLSDAVAPATAVLPVDHESARALQAEIQRAVAAEGAWRNAESPASTEDRIEGLTSDIFVSYAREDREKASALAKMLGARGWSVWWDRKIAPGEAFDVVIERELGTCKCAIVLWSANSVNATWVRNEARRASRRRVLVPILIEHVETPLEFENLQAADLTTWDGAANHPELEAVFDTIRALSPIPYDRLARAAVEGARREFGAGRPQAAIASLERFRPAHDLVTRALTELRAEADRIEREHVEAARREAEAMQRQRELGSEKARIEELLGQGELDAAEQALATAKKRFGPSAEFGPLRERLDTSRVQAQRERRARNAVEEARREFGAGRRQAALASLEQFRPAHILVARALTELRAEADRVERERAEAARREAEAAQRRFRAEAASASLVEARAENTRAEAGQRELGTEKAPIEELLLRGELDAAEQTLASTEKTFEPSAEVRPAGQQSEANWLLSRTTSRPVVVVVPVLLALIVGTWLAGIWPGRAPHGSQDLSQQQNQRSESSTPVSVPAPNARTPGADTTGASTQRASDAPKTPIEGVQTTPGAAPQISGAPKESAEGTAHEQASPSRGLEDLSTRARSQVQSGQRAQALNTVVEGLKIDPKDSVLRNILDSLLHDAQVSAERSKQDAMNLDAGARAEETFGQGLRRERQALSLRRTGRLEAATRSFWGAADQFSAAAAESRRVVEDEQAEPVRSPIEQAPQRPKADDQAERKSLDLAVEQDVVTQTLRRYEAAYARLNANAVRSVYPSGPIDQLEKDFAGYRSYSLTFLVDVFNFLSVRDSRPSVTVPGRAIHDILLKSGERTQFERRQIFTLEKQGNTWVIVHIHIGQLPR